MWTINIIIHNIGSTLLPHLHKHTVSAVHLQTYTACEFIAPVTIIYYYIIILLYIYMIYLRVIILSKYYIIMFQYMWY